MGAFLRQMVDSYTDITDLLMSLAKRGRTPRYPWQGGRSDGDAVMSDFATTISDLGVASSRIVEKQSKTRVP
ncbi:MAG: hypothetical protein F4X60_05190 [Gemmatimonadetes bacterium]|nr:hypothetical protein [Gemmatimonadota bacterium]MYB97936.1 hypothetical protein [Gemmatimonadota bacterium]